MSSLSIWHWIIIVLFVLIIWAFVAVFGRVANRAGYSRWWLVTLFVPVVNLIMLWVFAYANWPVFEARRQA